MSSRVNKLVSVLCVLALMVGLVAVPVSAARPMMGGAAVEETPVGETVHGHTHALPARPAVDNDQQAELLAANLKVCTFPGGVADNTNDFTVAGGKGSNAKALTGVMVNGESMNFAEGAALKMDSKGSCVVKGAQAGDTLTVVLSHKSTKTSFKLNGVVKTWTNNVYTEKLDKAGDYTISQDSGETYLYYVSVGSTCDHVWSVKSTTPATCIGGGETVYACSKCGNEKAEPIPATGNHTWGSDGKCTTTGCTAINPAMCSHSMTTVTPKAATCTEDGVVGGQYCTICGQNEEAAKEVIPAKGHNWQADGTCANGCGEVRRTSFLAAAGDLESAYALWPIESGVSKYEAYIIDSSNKETQVDDSLIRQYSNYMRVDVLGLKAGSYKIKVKDNKGGEMTTDALTVKAHDRTGFGFVGGSSSGAYNDDGTLKSGAKVVYVTNATFDTVQLTVKNAKGEDVTLTGVQAIVNESGVSKTAPGTPVCIRVLGAIDTTGFPKGSWGSGAEGLQVKGANAGTAKNLTIEGVGNDAVFNGFGVLIRNCSNVEVRNIGLFNFADDGISIDTGNDHLWIHNNDFFYGGVGGDADQAKGDGSLDSKGIQYATESYNHFWDSGKCCLMGMGGGKDHYVTFHHNWFDHSDSRHPRVREAEVHIYNNFYDTNAKFGVGSAVGAPIFVEGNYFLNCKYPMCSGLMGSEDGQIFSGEAGGVIKSWNNTIVGEKSFYTYQEDPSNFDAYVATSRDEVIPSTVKAPGGTYNNFDTKMDLGVTAAQVQSPEEAMKTVTRWAGRVQGGDFQYEFDEETQHWSAGDEVAAAVISELKSLVSNYKGTLVKVGGTVDTSKVKTDEHVCEAGRWVVTEAPSGTSKGVKTQYCVICGEEMRTAEVGTTTAGGGGLKNTLTYSHFKESKHADNYAVTQADLDKLYGDEDATANSGYFKVVGDKVLLRATTTGSSALTCIQLPKGGGSGVSFTVTHVPATVKVEFGSTKDGQKSTLVMKNSAGALVADENGATSIANNKGLKTPTTVTYTLETVGTYTVSASEANGNSDYNVRLLTLAVTEAEAPCEHEETTHHAAVAATCTKDGNKEYWTCNDCKKNFSDAACTKVITDVTIESTGHKWGDWVVSADGKTQTRTCSVCKTTETEAVDNNGPDEPATVAVTGVSVTKAVQLTMGGTTTATLTATVSPSNATNKVVTWASSNTAVATVANGVVTAVAAGSATITVTTVDGGKTATCAVTVKAAASTEGKSYVLTGDEVFGTLTPNGKDTSTTPHDIYNFDQGEKLENKGTDGYFTIYSNAGKESKLDYSKKTVEDYSGTYRFNFGGGATMVAEDGSAKIGSVIGFTTKAPATVKVWWLAGGADRPMGIYQADSNTPVKTGTKVGAKDAPLTEVFELATAGTYYLGSTNSNNNIFKVEVTETSGGVEAKPVTGVTLDQTSLTLTLDGTKTATLKATVAPADADEKTVYWDSSDPAVATVDDNGVVTAKAKGTATITVTTLDGGKTASCSVTVNETSGGGGGNGGGGGGGGIGFGTATPPATTPPTTTVPFVDVAENAWYHDTVEKAYNMGLMKGTDATHFTPNQNTSRAMIATILYRLDGEKKTSVKAAFDDVAAGQWYTEAIEWAANAGVVKGYDEDTFAPDDNITREQLAVMLYRYADPGNKRIAGDATLTDFVDAASVSDWATQAMEWAVKCGIITGKGANNLDPQGLATRAEAATMLMRFVDLKK